jgi:hypothetical protein
MSNLYQKIPGLYAREETRPFKLIEGVYREPEIEVLKDIEWEFTEKVDGTNIRVIWDGHKVTFGGRTDNAQLPSNLVTKLTHLFQGTANEQLFEQVWRDTPVTLIGEGYGAKIQSGGDYSDTQQFVLFDVEVDGLYLRRADVEDVATKFGIDVVPVVHRGPLQEGVDLVKAGLKSCWGGFMAEGLVAKTSVPLYTRRGERIITKIKLKDLVGNDKS